MRSDDKQSNGGWGSRAQAAQLNFLGFEFLTWLYFYLDQEGNSFVLTELCAKWDGHDKEAKVTLGKNILLRPLTSTEARVSVTSSMLDDSAEVLQAIRGGSHVSALDLEFTLGERVHSATLQAIDGSFARVKTRYLFDEQEKGEGLSFVQEGGAERKEGKHDFADDEAVLLRMTALDELEDIVDGLYQRFLARRLAQAFVTQDIHHIRTTIAEGLAAKLPKVAAKPASDGEEAAA